MTSPRSLKAMSRLSRRWVPMTISTAPEATLSKNFSTLLLRVKAQELRNANGERAHPLAKGLKVLQCQHCRWNQKGHLLVAVYHGFKSSAHRNFCFAIANIATDQAIHELFREQILFNSCYCGLLIPCQYVGKGLFKSHHLGAVGQIPPFWRARCAQPKRAANFWRSGQSRPRSGFSVSSSD